MKWYIENGNEVALDIAAELCLSAMTTSLILNEAGAEKMIRQMSVSPFSEASFALHLLLKQKPTYFVTEEARKALGGKRLLSSPVSFSLVCYKAAHRLRPPSRVGGSIHGKQSSWCSYN